MEKQALPPGTRILLTNDDGVNAPGLELLRATFSEQAEVTIVAPQASQSAMSHATTSRVPVRVHRLPPRDGVTVYAVEGTPVDCVKLALDNLLPTQPDLVISGINHGSNASVNALYSGTVGAALEATTAGLKSVAFSTLYTSHLADLSPCAPYCLKIVQRILESQVPERTSFNVNFPAQRAKGIKLCRQANVCWRNSFVAQETPRGHTVYWLSGDATNLEPEATDTDLYYLQEGYISMVPLTIDWTNHAYLEQIAQWSW